MRYAILAGVLALASVLVVAAVPGEARLVVHEWGTFTSVSAADGVPIRWRPLSGPTDLPKFVHGRPVKGSIEEANFDKLHSMTTIRMETPVLYFYSDRETDVDVKVGFPEGQVTEWYPKASMVKQGIDWSRIRVRPGAQVDFPREEADSHYYPARETNAAPVRTVSAEDEKFLFYRGVGWFKPTLKITLQGDRVVVKNPGRDVVPQAILVESRQGVTGFRVLGAIKDETSVTRPELSQGGAVLLEELQRTLVRMGLYEKEARAMVNTWSDSWFEEGLRLFYIVPRPAVDAILPLVVDPKPADVVRVFVGRAELITPEMERSALAIVKNAGDDLAAARRDLMPFGRFTGPVLNRTYLLASDPEVKARIGKLLGE
jgi:hypothetical protein